MIETFLHYDVHVSVSKSGKSLIGSYGEEWQTCQRVVSRSYTCKTVLKKIQPWFPHFSRHVDILLVSRVHCKLWRGQYPECSSVFLGKVRDYKHLCTCRANESRHLEIIACNQHYCRVEWKFAVLVCGIHVCHTASHISNSKNWEKAHFSSFLHFFEESQFSRAFCEEVKVQNRWMPGSVFNKDGGRWVRVYFLGLVWWIFPWFRFLASWSSMNMRHNTLTKLF